MLASSRLEEGRVCCNWDGRLHWGFIDAVNPPVADLAFALSGARPRNRVAEVVRAEDDQKKDQPKKEGEEKEFRCVVNN